MENVVVRSAITETPTTSVGANFLFIPRTAADSTSASVVLVEIAQHRPFIRVLRATNNSLDKLQAAVEQSRKANGFILIALLLR